MLLFFNWTTETYHFKSFEIIKHGVPKLDFFQNYGPCCSVGHVKRFKPTALFLSDIDVLINKVMLIVDSKK